MRVYSLGSPFGFIPCEALGESVGVPYNKEPRVGWSGDPIAVWGQLRGAKELLSQSKNFYRMDHAYIGRLKFFRLTKGDFQPSRIVGRPSDRWDELRKEFGLEVKPWRAGNHILVTLSAPATYWFFGVDDWPQRIEKEIRKYTDRPIKIRQREEKRPLAEDLKDAHCLVTYASNSSVDALRAGVPVFTLGPSIARPMSGDLSKIETPLYPENREDFFRHMSYCQFTVQEFRSGFALKTADENNNNGDLNVHRASDSG